TAPGTDSKISEDKIKGYKHFANKLWNITRFVLTNCSATESAYTDEDHVLLNEWQQVAERVTEDIEQYRLHLATEKLYQYVWTRFADEILEESKLIFNGTNSEARISRQKLLLELLAGNIKLLHPFMPFVTEALWELLPLQNKRPFVMIEPWPVR
ncbi:MAG TPA: class I tRNA ligase family protein, partial [Candidatus Paceibacterota bacterium]|nr:class I tRNA ligase family protein [Candidatus Paceibacterota bacterium]